MRQHSSYAELLNAEKDELSLNVRELSDRNEEMREYHENESRSLKTSIEDLGRQSDYNRTEWETARNDWERKVAVDSENYQQMFKGISHNDNCLF